MSKIYDKYLSLKEKNETTIYLFECGNFYIALDSDAILLNEMFDFRLTKFSNFCDKCGFPKNSIAKYEELLKQKSIDYKIIIPDNIDEKTKLKKINELILSKDFNIMKSDEMLNLIKSIQQIIME